MNKVLPFLKSNVLSLSAVLAAVILAPVMVFLSRAWASRIHDAVAKEVAQQVQQLEATDATFRIEPYLSGQQPISIKAPPNEATINAVASLLQRVIEGSEEIRRRAVEFNSRDKTPLIAGAEARESLFPDNPDESTRLRLLDRFAERWVQAHEELLREFNAGRPPNPATVRATLEEIKNKEVARLSPTGTEAGLTGEQHSQLVEHLGRSRLDLYRGHASTLCFYAEPAVFPTVVPWDRTKVLLMETAWEWQHLYWVHRDIIKALALANSDSLGVWRPVHLGPVKLVESIVVSKPTVPSRSSFDERPAAPSGGSPDSSAEVPRNYTLSHTGRAAHPVAPNPIYDIRYVDLTLIVAASRLPQILAAFPKVNFITVVGVNLEEVDPLPFLSAGYDFGSDHVVRAVIRLETVWLRSWMKKWMPLDVRNALGIPADPSPEPPSTPPGSGM